MSRMKKHIKRTCLLILMLVLVGQSIPHAYAAAELELAENEIDSFAQQYFSEEKLAENKLSSAAMAVVQGGQVVYSEAFGLQNQEERTQATPDGTMFRIGSISKTFVGTAVMQLAEQGKLDMHRDVNDYLPFRIPDTHNRPITLHHLLTHTSGFEEVYLNTVSLDYQNRMPLAEYVKEHVPKRLREPGRAIAYNNYGPTLAAYIVELVSGIPYEQYVGENILRPLAMNDTDLEVREQWLDRLALEYVYKNGRFKPLKIYSEHNFPSGDIIATTVDMAAYMIAHLQEMRGEANVLFKRAEKPIYDRQFTHHPNIPGYAYAFHERLHGGERMLEHGGTMAATNSFMLLSPESNFGLYFVFVGEQSPAKIVDDFLSKFFPEAGVPPEPLEPADVAPSSLAAFEGKYAPNIFPESDFTHFSLMTSDELTVEADGESLRLIGFGEDVAYSPVGEKLFRSAEGDYLVFEGDSVAYAGVVFDKLPWYHVSLSSNTIFLLLALALFLGSAIVFFVRAIAQSVRKVTYVTGGRDLLIAGISASYLFTAFAFVYYIATVDTMFYLNARVPMLLKAAMVSPLIGMLFTAGLLVWAALLWKRSSIFGKIYVPVFIAASCGFLFVMNYYRLAGFHY